MRSSFRPDNQPSSDRLTTRRAFTQRLLTNLLNPKAILFFAAVLPQFIVPGPPTALQVLILGIVDVLAGLVLWAVLIWVGAASPAAAADQMTA